MGTCLSETSGLPPKQPVTSCQQQLKNNQQQYTRQSRSQQQQSHGAYYQQQNNKNNNYNQELNKNIQQQSQLNPISPCPHYPSPTGDNLNANTNQQQYDGPSAQFP